MPVAPRRALLTLVLAALAGPALAARFTTYLSQVLADMRRVLL